MEGSWGASGERGGFFGGYRGLLFHQHCTRKTRAEQDPAGEWGAFSKERSTGAPFLTPRSRYPALRLLLAAPLHSILHSVPFLGRLIQWLKCDFLVFLLWNCILPLAFPSHPLIPPTYSPLELNQATPLCFSIIMSTSKSLTSGWLERRKGPGMRQISLAFPSHNASHLNPPIYCWSHPEWYPWWSVVFVPHMNSKDRRIHFPLFVFNVRVERDVSKWQNWRVTRSTFGCCLPAFSPSRGALQRWSHDRELHKKSFFSVFWSRLHPKDKNALYFVLV